MRRFLSNYFDLLLLLLLLQCIYNCTRYSRIKITLVSFLAHNACVSYNIETMLRISMGKHLWSATTAVLCADFLRDITRFLANKFSTTTKIHPMKNCFVLADNIRHENASCLSCFNFFFLKFDGKKNAYTHISQAKKCSMSHLIVRHTLLKSIPFIESCKTVIYCY